MESRCTASVFTTIVRAPWMPIRWRRWTELPPAPPHPITRTRGRASVKESRNDWFPVRCAVSRPIRDPIPGGPRWRPPLPARLRGRAFPAISLAVGPFHGLVEPPADVLPDRVADRVLHGHGVARLDELLKVHHVSFRQFDHELADVIRRELDVDETVDCGTNRIGDRRERTAFHELMEGFHFVRRQPDGDPLRFRWHRPPPQFGFLSDIRMTITLYKHMSTRLSKVRTPTPREESKDGVEIGVADEPRGLASDCFSGCVRPRRDAGPPARAGRTSRIAREDPSSVRTTHRRDSSGIDPTLQRSRPRLASARRRFRGASSLRAT